MTDFLAGGYAQRLGDDFWAGTGLVNEFPRPVERVVALRLPLCVVKLPEVAVGPVGRWLGERELVNPLAAAAGDLRGLLFARRGYGYAFVCGADPPDEQRLTVAHEAAHFILDYQLPRRQILAAMGPGAAEVLDGIRQATPAERAAALMAHVRLGPYVHLLPRRGADDGDAPVVTAEARADALALELAAPRRRVAEAFWHLAGPNPAGADGERLERELSRLFGLPPYVFRPAVRAATRPRRSPLLEAVFAAAHARREREQP